MIGAFRFFINADGENPIDLLFTADIPTSETMSIDWGDGNVEENVPITMQPATLSHTYAEPGNYVANWTCSGPHQMAYIDCANTQLTGIEYVQGDFPVMQAINLNDCAINTVILGLLEMFEGTLALSNNGLSALVAGDLPQGLIVLHMIGNNLNEFNFQDLPVSIEEIQVQGNTLSTNLEFTGLDNLEILNMVGNGCPDVNPATLPVSLRIIDMSNNAFDSQQVDDILVRLDANGQVNGTVDLSGQNPSGAPPGPAGIAAQASLEGKGWTVTVDS